MGPNRSNTLCKCPWSNKSTHARHARTHRCVAQQTEQQSACLSALVNACIASSRCIACTYTHTHAQARVDTNTHTHKHAKTQPYIHVSRIVPLPCIKAARISRTGSTLIRDQTERDYIKSLTSQAHLTTIRIKNIAGSCAPVSGAGGSWSTGGVQTQILTPIPPKLFGPCGGVGGWGGEVLGEVGGAQWGGPRYPNIHISK